MHLITEAEAVQQALVAIGLRSCPDGDIEVCVIEGGQPAPCGILLRLNKYGVELAVGVSPRFGFPLDEDGRIDYHLIHKSCSKPQTVGGVA